MELPFLEVLRTPVHFCVCQITTYVIACKQKEKRSGKERQREREQGRSPRNKGLFVSFTIPISLPAGISSVLNDVSHF